MFLIFFIYIYIYIYIYILCTYCVHRWKSCVIGIPQKKQISTSATIEPLPVDAWPEDAAPLNTSLVKGWWNGVNVPEQYLFTLDGPRPWAMEAPLLVQGPWAIVRCQST